MSRGKSQPRSQSGRRALGRCGSTCNVENLVIIDSDVDIVDAPESSHQGSRGLRETWRNMLTSNAISIDDDEEDTDNTPKNANDDDISMTYSPESSNSPLDEEFDSDESLMFVGKGNFPSKSMTKMRMCHEHVSSRDRFGSDLASESDSSSSSRSATSESDSSDCEIVEVSSGNIREQWERAALRKKMLVRDQLGSEDWANASGLSTNPESSSLKKTHDKVDMENFIDKTALNPSEEMPAEGSPSNSSNGKENLYCSADTADELIEDPPLKAAVNTCVADSDPTAGICHEGPDFRNNELISEKSSHGGQSADEVLFDQRGAVFRDLEVPLSGISIRNSRLRRDIRDEIIFNDKNQRDPIETSFCTSELHGDTSFQDKEGPSPVKTSPCSPQPWDGTQVFLGSVSFRDKKEQDFGEPSCGILLPYDDHGIFFQEKENNEEATLGESIWDHHAGSGTTGMSLSSHTEPRLQRDLIGKRERHKESDVYKRVAGEEWASRQRQLQIQAEEAQRLQKRIRDEKRVLDMERRQKRRLEEIRESQRKVEETTNLKEKLRAEVRKEIDKIELRYRDMVSLLRAFGIRVEGGPYPMPREVNAAYKQALLKFHPDRTSRSDVQQQVEAEEKFKLISRLKEKLLAIT